MPRIQADSVAAHRALMEGRLLDAFGELMIEQGYGRTTLADVASRAGMARNTVYNYVADKESLFYRYLDRAIADFLEQVQAQLAVAAPGPDRLRVFIHAQLTYFAGNPNPSHDMGVVLSPERHAELEHHLRPLRTALAQILREGMDVGLFRRADLETTLDLIMACVAAERVPLSQGRRRLVDSERRVTEFVLYGISAPS